MISNAVASFLIAFFATAGAVPLLRNMLRPSLLPGPAEGSSTPVAPPGIAGAGMVFGVLISLFYVDSSASGVTGLFVSVMVLALVSTRLRRSHRVVASAAINSRRDELVHEWGASAVAGLALLCITPLSSIGWTQTAGLILVMVVLSPAAVSSLSRTDARTAALPAATALIQILLILLLGVLDLHRVQRPMPFMELTIILLPAAGALTGALIYLCRTPWRPQASASTGIATRLCLGLMVGWAAGRMGMASDKQSLCMVALLWILAVPVFHLLRQGVLFVLKRAFPERNMSGWGELLDADHASTSIVVFAVIFGVVGIAFWQLNVPDRWAAMALVPAWLAFSLWPVVLLTFSRRYPQDMLDARS